VGGGGGGGLQQQSYYLNFGMKIVLGGYRFSSGCSLPRKRYQTVLYNIYFEQGTN